MNQDFQDVRMNGMDSGLRRNDGGVGTACRAPTAAVGRWGLGGCGYFAVAGYEQEGAWAVAPEDYL